MKPAPFVHHAPRTVEDAVAVLAEIGHDGKVLAGGQSLIPILNMRLASPAHLVDINRVEGIDSIEVTDGHVRIGALVRHTGLERSDEAYAALPLLRQALAYVAHPVIRNRGTAVGSIAHADAAGELPAVLVLCDGVVEAASTSGLREITAADFFLGALETSLAAEELATAVRFRRFEPGTGTAFTELARRHGDYALAGVAAAVTVTDGLITRARAAFVSVTDVPSVLDLTDVLKGSEPSVADWHAAAEAVRAHVTPDGDIHATAEYRRMLVGELSRRALAEAAAAAMAPTPTLAPPTHAPPPALAPNAALGVERTGIPLSSTPNAAFGGKGSGGGGRGGGGDGGGGGGGVDPRPADEQGSGRR